jgi:hypothetical protein
MFKQRKFLCLLVVFAITLGVFSGLVFANAGDTGTPEIQGYVMDAQFCNYFRCLFRISICKRW